MTCGVCFLASGVWHMALGKCRVACSVWRWENSVWRWEKNVWRLAMNASWTHKLQLARENVFFPLARSLVNFPVFLCVFSISISQERKKNIVAKSRCLGNKQRFASQSCISDGVKKTQLISDATKFTEPLICFF